MMSNALVNVANLGPSLRAAFPLMLNDLTGVPGLCEKKTRKQKSRIGSLKWPKTSYRIPFPRLYVGILMELNLYVQTYGIPLFR